MNVRGGHESMSKRILIIDDSIEHLDILKEVLTFSGFEVKTAADGRRIVSMVQEFHPHLVLLDYVLPVINGAELAAQLKGDPASAHIPIILMSAYLNAAIINQCHCCDGILYKPFDLDFLLRYINQILNKAASPASFCKTDHNQPYG